MSTYQEAAVSPMQPQHVIPIEPKKPGLHALLSAVIPGLGSMMAGDAAIGAFILLATWVLWPVLYITLFLTGVMVIGLSTEPGSESAATGGFIAVISTFVMIGLHIATYVFGIVRGYSAAHRWNRRRGLA